MAALSSSTATNALALATLLTQGERIATSRLVLASQSPRRKEIFDLMGLKGSYEVIVSGFPENLDKSLYCGEGGPARYAKDNACCKAREVMQRIAEEEGAPTTIVVGSDTIVDLDGQILEKPGDAEEAKSMLRRLSGREHLVHSGVGVFMAATGAKGAAAAAAAAEPAVAFSETTRVRFGKLSEEDIAAYVQSGEPMDKAGSYGI